MLRAALRRADDRSFPGIWNWLDKPSVGSWQSAKRTVVTGRRVPKGGRPRSNLGNFSCNERRPMSELSERTRTKLDHVLEETCRRLPNGGDHVARKFVAQRLIEAAQAGHVTRGELGIIARRAIADLAEGRR